MDTEPALAPTHALDMINRRYLVNHTIPAYFYEEERRRCVVQYIVEEATDSIRPRPAASGPYPLPTDGGLPKNKQIE